MPAKVEGFTVRLHPDGPVYAGDLVSFEVISPPGVDLQDKTAEIIVDTGQGTHTLNEKFGYFGLGNRSQATFTWAWDTSGLAAGDHNVYFSIKPHGPTWTETVTIHPRSQVPPPEPKAAWATAKTACCVIHYITGTAVERDLPKLLEIANQQARDVSQKFQTNISEPIEITILPRVLGNGGFTTREIAVTYLDRDYGGDGTDIIIHHEMVHLLDARLGGEVRPTLLVEGLAVDLSGGHFKPEPLMPRAAALLAAQAGCQPVDLQSLGSATPVASKPCSLDMYIPMEKLADNFYLSQHEIGYLEASALVEFMVKTWGWPAFSAFYRDIHSQPEPTRNGPQTGVPQQIGGPQYRAINAALQSHFGLSFQALDERFLQALSQEELTPQNVADVRLTLGYHDAIRRYQQLLDPSAYFLNTWLPDMVQMRQRGIVADFLRRPSVTENLALETMLAAADRDSRSGDYASLDRRLKAINAVLAGVANHNANPFAADPLAADYWALTQAAMDKGYQPQIIQLNENEARVWGNTTGPDLVELDFMKIQGVWTSVQEASSSFLQEMIYGQLNSIVNGALQ